MKNHSSQIPPFFLKTAALGIACFGVVAGSAPRIHARPPQEPKTSSIKLYFPTPECDGSLPMTRKIPQTARVADQALRLLLAGPTEAERKLGVTNGFEPAIWFEKGTQPLANYYRGLDVKKGVAIVNFKPGAMAYLNSTTCVQSSVKDPIERTLRQFPGVREVKFAIDGEVVEEWDA